MIAFARIQRLDLLHEVVGNIVIPDEVANEISRCRHRPYCEIRLERESVGTLLEKMRQCGIRYSERFIQAVLREIGGVSTVAVVP